MEEFKKIQAGVISVLRNQIAAEKAKANERVEALPEADVAT